MLMLKSKASYYFWLILFHYLGVVHDYNKEKGTATNKITSTTIITEATKTVTSKNFPFFQRQLLLKE